MRGEKMQITVYVSGASLTTTANPASTSLVVDYTAQRGEGEPVDGQFTRSLDINQPSTAVLNNELVAQAAAAVGGEAGDRVLLIAGVTLTTDI